MKVWILTSECNDYNQYGEYFEAVFAEKPTAEQLRNVCGLNDIGVLHVLDGGGRQRHEDQWYNLSAFDI